MAFSLAAGFLPPLLPEADPEDAVFAALPFPLEAAARDAPDAPLDWPEALPGAPAAAFARPEAAREEAELFPEFPAALPEAEGLLPAG